MTAKKIFVVKGGASNAVAAQLCTEIGFLPSLDLIQEEDLPEAEVVVVLLPRLPEHGSVARLLHTMFRRSIPERKVYIVGGKPQKGLSFRGVTIVHVPGVDMLMSRLAGAMLH